MTSESRWTDGWELLAEDAGSELGRRTAAGNPIGCRDQKIMREADGMIGACTFQRQ